ncbi:MAG: pilus assembly protein PilO [Cyanobacteria bacterium SW_9_44_58]|nr:MAG: pilus assembly protein PilO [Cyanobacteria bacterium SW_9_44_58]
MTFSDELPPEEQLEEEEGPQYPEAFGITFTPLVSGIAFAVLGIAGAGYMWFNFVQPARQEYSELRNQRDNLEAQIEQQPVIQGKIKELESEIQIIRSQQKEVLNLLSSEKSLDTLSFDLEQTIQQATPASTQQESNQFELTRFEPLMATPEVVSDDSFGEAANGKIQRKTYSLEIVGTFAQTQSLIQQLERLQPLLLVNNFSTEVTEQPKVKFSFEQNRFIVAEKPRLRSSFQLEAILPVSQEKLQQTDQQKQENGES